jgi:hypothetical protein
MEIKLTTTTHPATISRALAAKLSNRSQSMVHKAIKANHIDYGTSGRNKLIVVNKKWRDYVRLCHIRDYLKARGFTSLRGTAQGILREAQQSGTFTDLELKLLAKSKVAYK